MRFVLLFCFVQLFISCDIESPFVQANNAFDDQHFKTAIALIELHKLRYKEYPEKLIDLKYLGDWDKIIFSSISYKRYKDGYQLDIGTGMIRIAKSKIEYPADFLEGTGLKKSNFIIIKDENNK